jgi:hypothetical protein
MIKEFKISKPNKPLSSSLFYKQTGFNLFTKDDDFFIFQVARAKSRQMPLLQPTTHQHPQSQQ